MNNIIKIILKVKKKGMAPIFFHIRKRIYSFYMSRKFSFSGKNINIYPKGNMFISLENVKIGNNFNCLGFLKILSDRAPISIGNNCSFNVNVNLEASGLGIKVGDNVLIGPNVVLRDSNHVYQDASSLINKQGHTKQGIQVEDDVWVGANAVICPGVILGKGSVIAAGSVVTKATYPYAVYAGVPAKKIAVRKQEEIRA